MESLGVGDAVQRAAVKSRKEAGIMAATTTGLAGGDVAHVVLRLDFGRAITFSGHRNHLIIQLFAKKPATGLHFCNISLTIPCSKDRAEDEKCN